ncbi:cupin domain-containing protein [Micromonospora sp. WMMD1120]|uniref:cupin domain-containing protein n=1 Tax=Micromonospora sp. WMMD1120 TaxID=3016106 RepID=UPI0024179606|nr:cupin domain-containing protein [Micromonospora sp. WMMD1120]MDG4809336.1 cupin domain-containing protein [Micromonospora sp. WMMD1120]
MAEVGTVLRQGNTDTMTFRHPASASGGAYVEVEAVYSPMPDIRPPVHSHPRQDEHFEVLDGELHLDIEGERRVLHAGDALDLPRGLRHTAWNGGAERNRFIWRTTPALRTEAMYEKLWSLADEGKMGRHGSPPPGLLQGGVLMFAYRHEYRLARPPYPILLAGTAVLGAVGLLCGYRAHVPR